LIERSKEISGDDLGPKRRQFGEGIPAVVNALTRFLLETAAFIDGRATTLQESRAAAGAPFAEAAAALRANVPPGRAGLDRQAGSWRCDRRLGTWLMGSQHGLPPASLLARQNKTGIKNK